MEGEGLKSLDFRLASYAALKLETLRPIKIFSQFSDAELGELFDLGYIRTAPPHTHIIIEGEPTRGMFIILAGTVSVYKNDHEGSRMMRLSYLETGAVFGELSLFDDAPRSATVVAEAQVDYFYLDHLRFEEFLRSGGDQRALSFYRTCASDMVARFKKQNSDYLVAQELLWKHALRKE